jgi:hypothetical protein
LKTKLKLRIHALWLALTEVPGWPDAPVRLRVQRALPIVLPTVLMLALLAWRLAWIEPHVRSVRAAEAPLVALAQEVAALEGSDSEEQIAALEAKANHARSLLLDTPEQLAVELRKLEQMCAAAGWEGRFTSIPTGNDASGAPESLILLPARAKLVPSKTNRDTFSSLLTLLEQLSAGGKRIELTRVAVRADEGGRHSVELGLRFACRPKT